MNHNLNALAEFMGIMFGDGCLSRSGGKYVIYISGHKFDDLQYHNKITLKLINCIFNKEAVVKFRKDEKTLFIRFSDKLIFSILKNLGMPVGLKYKKMHIPKIFKKKAHVTHFIRGLFDTDGSVILIKRKKGVYPRIEITSKSENFLKEVKIELNKFYLKGFVCSKGRGYRLELPGFKNMNSWMQIIGSNNQKHLLKIKRIQKIL